ncbi:MAG: hypothetical protein MI784_03405 [Cytophagales bacterium]|nr:hypothetical protein [Cytophagales bacterium]
MRLTVEAKEWYGGKGVRTDIRQRFLRASVRQAIIVPPTGKYPHLTIDIDSVEYNHKKESVEFQVSRMHYSHRSDTPRIFFEERDGLFYPIEEDEMLVPLIPQLNHWLEKAALDLRIALHPIEKSKTKAGEPEASPISVAEPKAESRVEDKSVEELTSDFCKLSDKFYKVYFEQKDRIYTLRRKPGTFARRGFVGAQDIEANQLEDQLDMHGFCELMGVKNIGGLPAETKLKIALVNERFSKWNVAQHVSPLLAKIEEHRKSRLAEAELFDESYKKNPNDKLILRRAKKLSADREFVDTLPCITNYSLKDLIPPKEVINVKDSKDLAITQKILSFMQQVFDLQLQEMRVTEMVEYSMVTLVFLFEVTKHSAFYYGLAKSWFIEVKNFWDSIPESKMLTCGKHVIKMKEIEDKIIDLEKYWGVNVHFATEMRKKTTWALDLWFKLKSADYMALDMKIAPMLAKGKKSFEIPEQILVRVLEKYLEEKKTEEARNGNQ